MTVKELNEILSERDINVISNYVKDKIDILNSMHVELENVLLTEGCIANFTKIDDIGKINSKIITQVRLNKIESFFYSCLNTTFENKSFNDKVKNGSKKREINAKGLILKYMMEAINLGLTDAEIKLESISMEESSDDNNESLTYLEKRVRELAIDLLIPDLHMNKDLARKIDYSIRNSYNINEVPVAWIREQYLSMLSQKYRVDTDIVIEKLKRTNVFYDYYGPESSYISDQFLVYGDKNENKDKDGNKEKGTSYQINKPEEK